jgi:hypothetical protein
MVTITFRYEDVPPSLNQSGARGHWRTFHKTKKAWQATIEVLLLADFGQPPRPFDRCRVETKLMFPQSRRRDSGNFRALLEKATGDALVNGRWLTDDTPDRYQFADPLITVERGGRKRTEFTFTFE